MVNLTGAVSALCISLILGELLKSFQASTLLIMLIITMVGLKYLRSCALQRQLLLFIEFTFTILYGTSLYIVYIKNLISPYLLSYPILIFPFIFVMFLLSEYVQIGQPE